jgi:hypothetical protein
VNPQAKNASQKEQSGQKEVDGQQATNDQKSQAALEAEAAGQGAAAPKAGGEWGNLPMKEAREVMESSRRQMPQKYREQLERYYKGLSNGGR